jgi:hypothetical protein
MILYIILCHATSRHIISYHIISYHIISYHIISYHIISYHIIYHIIIYYIILYIFFYWFCMFHYNNCVILHAITYKVRLTWFEISLSYIYYSFSKSIESKKFRNESRCIDIRCCLLGGHCPAFMALFLLYYIIYYIILYYIGRMYYKLCCNI